MIEISEVEVTGWEAAIRGMRNPLESHAKIDSSYVLKRGIESAQSIKDFEFKVGNNDLQLMNKLAHAGSDHGKFARYINVTFDLSAPIYYFKEFDTYKISTVANSYSTMHRLHVRDLTLDDFSTDHLEELALENLEDTIDLINGYRRKYLESKEKKDWWQMIQLLPSSYNQKRTIQLNYQVLWNMYQARKNHKLDEWRKFCSWIETLPYFKEIFLTDLKDLKL